MATCLREWRACVGGVLAWVAWMACLCGWYASVADVLACVAWVACLRAWCGWCASLVSVLIGANILNPNVGKYVPICVTF